MGLVRGHGCARQLGLSADKAYPELKSEVLPHRPGQLCSTVQESAETLISRFCEDVPATRVAPTQAELEALRSRCCLLKPVSVASATVGQLANAIGAHAWQPQLRALQVLEHMYRYGGDVGRAVNRIAKLDAFYLVKHVAEQVPECQIEAQRVLELWEFGEAVSERAVSSTVPPRTVSSETVLEERRNVTDREDLLSFSDTPQDADGSCCSAPSGRPPCEIAAAQAIDHAEGPCAAPAVALALDDQGLIEALLAMTTPDRFDIAPGEVCRENPELNKIFGFSHPIKDRWQALTGHSPSDPVYSPMSAAEFLRRETADLAPDPPDPFAFVADQMAIV